MEIKEGKLKGTFEITLNPIVDSRGFFMRTFDDKVLKKSGINNIWVQENHSRSETKGIIRGMHFQFPPFAESKLVRCVSGKILDVFIDLRLNSESFGQWDSIELSAENKKMILIPRGFAHGFCTLTEFTEVLYKVDNYYSKENEMGIIWNDPTVKLNWPIKSPILSEKDKNNISFDKFIRKFKGIQL